MSKQVKVQEAASPKKVPVKITVRLDPKVRNYAQSALDMGADLNFSKIGNVGLLIWFEHMHALLLLALMKSQKNNNRK